MSYSRRWGQGTHTYHDATVKTDVIAFLRQLPVLPPCIFYEEDWKTYVQRPALECGMDQIDLRGFMRMLKAGLERHWRAFAGEIDVNMGMDMWGSKNIKATLCGIKALLMRSAAIMRDMEVCVSVCVCACASVCLCVFCRGWICVRMCCVCSGWVGWCRCGYALLSLHSE